VKIVLFYKIVNYFITTVSKLFMRTANLNAILGSQNCVFEKAGIGYQCGFKGKQKKFSNFFKSNDQPFSPFMTCFYSIRKDHFVRNCKTRKFDVLKDLVRWVPKSITKTCGLKLNRVPTPQT